MRQKILKTGHSLAVTIPSKFAKSLGVKQGDDVQLKVDLTSGKIQIFFGGVRQLSLVDNNKRH